MSEHNNLNWKDFILCLSMELAFGDGSKDNEVYKTIENKMSRLEYYDIKKEVVTWNVKNIVNVINALIQKMKAIPSVSGATKWAQNHGMPKTLFLVKSIFVLFVVVQNLEHVIF